MSELRCCTDMHEVACGALYDDRYGNPAPAHAVRCTACGHTRLVDPPGKDALGTLYSTFYPRATFDPDDYRPYARPGPVRGWLEGARANAALWVTPRSRVLEIGCGYGQTIGYLQALGCEVQATELDSNVAELARRKGFRVKIGHFDAGDYPQNHFDYVLLSQVLEHIAQPDALLGEIRRVLRPGGTLVITTPNGGSILRRILDKRWIHWHAPYHVQLFTRASLARLAERKGYAVRVLRTLSPSSWLLYQWCHLVGRPPRGSAHPFWDERTPKSMRQRVAYRLITLATHSSRVNHLLTRCLDATGLGDNLVALLTKA